MRPILHKKKTPYPPPKSKESSSALCCGICFNGYRIAVQMRQPLVGPCGHSVCRRCASQITNCPFCRSSVRPINVNFGMIDAMKELENLKQSSKEEKRLLKEKMKRKMLNYMQDMDVAGDEDEDEDDDEEDDDENQQNIRDEILYGPSSPTYQMIPRCPPIPSMTSRRLSYNDVLHNGTWYRGAYRTQHGLPRCPPLPPHHIAHPRPYFPVPMDAERRHQNSYMDVADNDNVTANQQNARNESRHRSAAIFPVPSIRSINRVPPVMPNRGSSSSLYRMMMDDESIDRRSSTARMGNNRGEASGLPPATVEDRGRVFAQLARNNQRLRENDDSETERRNNAQQGQVGYGQRNHFLCQAHISPPRDEIPNPVQDDNLDRTIPYSQGNSDSSLPLNHSHPQRGNRTNRHSYSLRSRK